MFGHIFVSSKNVPKSIAICPESLIGHLGIITPPKKTKTKKKRKYINEQIKNNRSPNRFAVFWILLDPVFACPHHGLAHLGLRKVRTLGFRKILGVMAAEIQAVQSQGVPSGRTQAKLIYAFFNYFVGHFYGKDVQIIGLKALGNYSASFWSSKISDYVWNQNLKIP